MHRRRNYRILTPGQMKKGKVNSANFALRFINSLYGVTFTELMSEIYDTLKRIIPLFTEIYLLFGRYKRILVR